ncbi:hypothetical protein QCA50_001720 [Cerrena zonata]|uniref:INO80 complex subunit B-like conserved region domain-containing protein n=1 Tax=Cerrena zonata TaxID=2478898 RepID=A0AAW0GU07_9APHY
MARKIIYDEEEEEDELQESSDMQMSEDDGDEGAQSNVGEDEVNPDDEEELSEKEDELEEEEQDGSDIDELSPPPSEIAEEEITTQPRLKIKLKLPTQPGTNNSTPGPSTTSRAASRRGPPRDDIDIESEDPESEEDVDSTRSNSVATNLPSRALTARQAALANVAETSHVSLVEPPNPRKKKPLTEDEIALKREETARKRKNLTEKKLEDEKAETINRLLKKQSRGKGRRNALASAEDKATPLASVINAQDEEEGVEGSEPPAVVLPTMYRWVSSIKTETNAGGESTKKMVLSFAVPTTAIHPSSQEDSSGAISMEVDSQPSVPSAKTLQLCDVPGCGVPRKYRLVKDWQRGACGMSHLKTLEAQLGTVA